MQANLFWHGLVVEEGFNRFLDICPQIGPGICLREDIVRKTFSYETTVIFLLHAEHNFHDRNSAINQTLAASYYCLNSPAGI